MNAFIKMTFGQRQKKLKSRERTLLKKKLYERNDSRADSRVSDADDSAASTSTAPSSQLESPTRATKKEVLRPRHPPLTEPVDITHSILKVKTQEESASGVRRLSITETQSYGDDSEPLTTPDHQRPVKVQFSNAYVHLHQCIMGDNPACVSGPPVTIDWNCDVSYAVPVGLMEEDNRYSSRRRRRKARAIQFEKIGVRRCTRYLDEVSLTKDLKLSHRQREELLMQCQGMAPEAVIKGMKQVYEVKESREGSCEHTLKLAQSQGILGDLPSNLSAYGFLKKNRKVLAFLVDEECDDECDSSNDQHHREDQAKDDMTRELVEL